MGVNLKEFVNVNNVWVFGFRVDVRWRYDRRGCCRRDDDGAAADDSTRGRRPLPSGYVPPAPSVVRLGTKVTLVKVMCEFIPGEYIRHIQAYGH